MQNHVEEVKLHEQEAATILLLRGVGKNALEKPLTALLVVRLRAQVMNCIVVFNLEKFGLNFSSSSFVIRVNLLHP